MAGPYYISWDTGNDETGAGTLLNPWKTPNKLFASGFTAPGEIGYARGGTYTLATADSLEKSGASGNPLIFRNYPDESPVFEYTAGYLQIGGSKDYITFDGLTVLRKVGTGSTSILIIGGAYATIQNCIYYVHPDYLQTAGGDGIVAYTNAEYLTVDNCLIYNAFNQGVDWTGAHHVTVKNSTVHDCQNGIVGKASAAPYNAGSHDNVVEKNFVYRTKYDAIMLGGDSGGHDADPGYADTDSVARNNLIWQEAMTGQGNARGLAIFGGLRCYAYNNTVIGGGMHITYANLTEYGLQPCQDCRAYNNIIIGRGATEGNGRMIKIKDSESTNGLLLKNNLYYQGSLGSPDVYHLEWLSPTDYGYAGYAALASWDTGSVTGNDTTDPKLVNYLVNLIANFKLQSDSPAIDTGFDLTGIVTEDYAAVARPQGGIYDIGAYEHQGAVEPPAGTNIDKPYVENILSAI